MKQPVNITPSVNPRVPEPQAPFFHSLPLQIRFNDADMLGHLNNSVYLTFMDLGKAHYFNDVMKGVDWRNINVAVVNINVSFFAPAYLDSNLSCLTAVTRVSEHSITLEQRVVDTDSGEVKCAATTIMAGYDVKTAQSRPIDPEWRRAIEVWEERTF